jgi:hypothetical protein
MSSRKKPRPSFDLPEEAEAGEQSSGWVYRSGNGSAAARAPGEPAEGVSILQNGSYAISYGMATMSQAMALALAIATLPLAIGARVIEDWASEIAKPTSSEPPASDAPSQPA